LGNIAQGLTRLTHIDPQALNLDWMEKFDRTIGRVQHEAIGTRSVSEDGLPRRFALAHASGYRSFTLPPAIHSEIFHNSLGALLLRKAPKSHKTNPGNLTRGFCVVASSFDHINDRLAAGSAGRAMDAEIRAGRWPCG
jgi:hypothetical protein